MKRTGIAALLLSAVCASVLLPSGCAKKSESSSPSSVSFRKGGSAPVNMKVLWKADLAEFGSSVAALETQGDVVVAQLKNHRTVAINSKTGVLVFTAPSPTKTHRDYLPVFVPQAVVLNSSSDLVVHRKHDSTGDYAKVDVVTPAGKGAVAATVEDPIITSGIGQGWMLYAGTVHSQSTVIDGMESAVQGRLYAVNIQMLMQNRTTPSWEVMVAGGVSGRPAVLPGPSILYVAGMAGRVYAIKLSDQAAAWPLPGGYFDTDGAVADRAAARDMINTPAGTNGRNRPWDTVDAFRSPSGAIRGSLFVDREGLLVPSVDSKLYCLDPLSGRVNWEYFAGESLRDGAVAGKVNVYLPVESKGIVALPKRLAKAGAESRIRKPSWVQPDATQFLAEDADYAYLRSKDGGIIVVGLETGETVRRTGKGITVAASNAADGRVFVVLQDNRVVAYSTEATQAP